MREEPVTFGEEVDELGFEPAISATGADPVRADAADLEDVADVADGDDVEDIERGLVTIRRLTRRRRRAAPSRLRRRVASGMALLIALCAVGGIYTVFAGSSAANAAGTNQADINAGQQIYDTSCITCHGANLQGVSGRGPGLIGVGSAAVYFQVSTGRMPATAQGGTLLAHPAKFDAQQIAQLGAYVQSLGGGPQVPQGNLRVADSELGAGGQLYRLNCASCHGATGKGAPLSAGKSAPSLRNATDQQLYTAMLTGPGTMPVFSDNQLTPLQKKQILSYVQTLKSAQDPGGNGLDRIGPVSEGLVIWILGIGALMIVILWIGAKT